MSGGRFLAFQARDAGRFLAHGLFRTSFPPPKRRQSAQYTTHAILMTHCFSTEGDASAPGASADGAGASSTGLASATGKDASPSSSVAWTARR